MIPGTDARQAIALAGQGQNVSEIARRLGHDRKTIRIYLNGHRAPGQPRPHADSFAPFAAYVRQRAADDPHLRSTGLHREVTALGYAGSYSAFTRELRGHGITAACGTCRKWKPIAPAQARGQLSRAAPVPHRPARRRDDRLLPVAHRGRQPPAGRRHHRLPPALVRRPGRRLRRPRRHRPAAARGHRSPGRAHRDQRNRPAAHAPRARRRRAPARPRDPRLPALRRPARAAPARSLSTSPLTSGPAGGTAPGSAAPSRSTSPPPRTSSPPAGTRPGSPWTTASPGSCSPKRPPASRRPATRAARRRTATLAMANPGLDPGHPDIAEAAAYPGTIKMATVILRGHGALPAGPE